MNTFGRIFRLTSFGESHGYAIGGVIDGIPAGEVIDIEAIQSELNRRRPGQSSLVSQRNEQDRVELLSGIFEGKTTGTPISMLVWNKTARSSDYSEIASYYRPGHADYTFDEKYGFRDYRGGGRSSGRETIGRVAAGAIAAKILKELGIEVMAYTKSIGPVSINYDNFKKELITATYTGMPDAEADLKAQAFLEECLKETDSAGDSWIENDIIINLG